ncbi:ATP-dependent DNA helicase RecG [Maricaulis sp.]|uniref:ATP-dependent DNA helicase RecG n=1 Tax=Maricaulis sp. TaxID=1486257 RepID=UPI002637FCC5|nr:ATP-dependent DNA helicase RecG [Maricaulis sp.]
MRPEILFPLFQDITALPGIGPRLAALLAKLAGPRVKDVLWLKPSSLVDRRRKVGIAEAPEGQIVTIQAQVEEHLPGRRKGQPYKVRLYDPTGFLHLIYFHPRGDYLSKLLPVGETRIISGKVERFGSEIQMVHPDLVMSEQEAETTALLEPVYPLTTGLTGKTVRKAMAGALKLLPDLPEWIDADLLVERRWPAFSDALTALHAPEDAQALEADNPVRERLAFDELLARQLALQLVRSRRKRQAGRALQGDGSRVGALLKHAPFAPTGAQQRSFAEIEQDMAEPERMTRLLHGDVGAGKTFVAALAAARAAEAGTQTALMAPTEILARQHARTLKALLEPAGLKVIALTGRDKGKARAQLLEQMAQSEVDVICGTHALFQEGVEFGDLGLVVIDEQHRFGVSDRLRLTAKGYRPDTLVMTATPIPRTLSLAVYGDLDVSRLDEKPAGRIPPTTRLISMDRVDDVIDGLRRALAKGERVYWVCPLVEESENSELTAAEDRWRYLRAALGDDGIGLLHGRMKPAEKEAIANAFRAGEIKVLVATTVIEVGVDAPDATIMIIEHAERFGLAQLHQLRGRVGRGDKRSSCLLLYKPPLGETAQARLEMLRESDDGFRIAEEDWRLRGAGDPLGLRQSGLPDFKLAEIEAHADLIELANDWAKLIVARDPELTEETGQALRHLLYLFDQDTGIRLLKSG